MIRKPRVLLVGTGGTISSVGAHPLDFYEYTDHGTKRFTAEELVTHVPELALVAHIIPINFRTLSSTAVGIPEWLELNEAIHHLVLQHAPVDGVVVTHGTASLEETAYFLNLSLKIEQTVVVVGSQRPLATLSTDANVNLVNAARVAGDPAARGLGVLVVLNDEIQAARDVTKGSTHRLETFRTHDLGMLGYADADGVVAIYRAPTRRHTRDTPFDLRGVTTLPRVDVSYSYAGADGAAIEAFVARGAKAIVSAGLPAGRPTPGEQVALDEAKKSGTIVVQSSRAGSGRVLKRRVVRAAGTVVADNLNPQKARILAMLGLTLTSDHEVLQDFFDTY
jgi:L-asparaginase